MEAKNFITLISCTFLLLVGFSSFSQEIRIGKQIWAAKNLDVSTFRNGDTIPEARSASEWYKFEKEKKPAWCYYNNDSATGSKYGKLYNWYAVNDKRGLAPKGWHVPTDTEWAVLIAYSGGKDISALRLKSDKEWSSENGKSGNGSNKDKFNALPAGSRTTEGVFSGQGKISYWWTSTRHTNGMAWMISMRSESNKIYRLTEECGLSVRLVKDAVIMK